MRTRLIVICFGLIYPGVAAAQTDDEIEVAYRACTPVIQACYKSRTPPGVPRCQTEIEQNCFLIEQRWQQTRMARVQALAEAAKKEELDRIKKIADQIRENVK